MKTYFIKLVIFITSVFTSIFYVQTCIGRQNTSAISYSWSDQPHMLQIQGGAIYLHQKNIVYPADETDLDFSPTKTDILNPSSVLFSNNTQAHLCAIYMPADHFGIKLLLATPFKLKKTLDENSRNFPIAFGLTTKILTPALSMEYYPLSSNSQWQPYVGLGVMVAHFDKLKFTDESGNRIELLKSSTDYTAGMMEEVGINYRVDENWSVGVSAMRSQLNSQLKIKFGNNKSPSPEPSPSLQILRSSVNTPAVKKMKSLLNWSLMAYRVNVGYRF